MDFSVTDRRGDPSSLDDSPFFTKKNEIVEIYRLCTKIDSFTYDRRLFLCSTIANTTA